ncbi:MAG TPA: lysophospholipid acyltransferase family protein [Terriglobales bacterium]
MSTQTENSAPANAKKRRAEGHFTLRQRLALWFITWAGYLAIRTICSTVRYTFTSEVEGEDMEQIPHTSFVAPFWHRAVFSATYLFRNIGIAVMTSSSFDGEYIARIINAFGFEAVRGSSTRGGVRALLGMHKVIEDGRIAAFTIDGPRGPRYVAKPGPVLLARNTKVPIRAFYIALDRRWELRSWDSFMIPKPFARAYVRMSVPIHVPPDADAAQMEQLHREMQTALERVTAFAEEQVLHQN